MLKRLGLTCKTMAGVVCLWAAMSGKYPPAHAQQMPQPDQFQMPSQMVISPYDPEFASDIKALNVHLTATDTLVTELTHRVDRMSEDNREMLTNMKWYFWIIGALLSGSIVLPNLKEAFEKLPKLRGKQDE